MLMPCGLFLGYECDDRFVIVMEIGEAGMVMVPQRGTETFISTIGHLDGRINLYKKGERLAEDIVASVNSEETSITAELGNRALMDLCIMASKLAYENAKVIREIVTDHWKASYSNNCSDIYLRLNFQLLIHHTYILTSSILSLKTDAFCGLL